MLCAQEDLPIEKERKKTSVFFLLGEGKVFDIYDVTRKKEIEACKSEKVKKQKTAVWNLLINAARFLYGLKECELNFKRDEFGKISCDKFYFSMSHANGASVVIISDSPCGVDVENLHEFSRKHTDKSFIRSFSSAMGERDVNSNDELLRRWTRKESVFKAFGKGVFLPKKISAEHKNVKSFKLYDCLFSVASENLEFEFYVFDGNDSFSRVEKEIVEI